jgi:UDP-2-acetamido-3-amino-2,3-dideoxy-glucuronate N-acetyltransferase
VRQHINRPSGRFQPSGITNTVSLLRFFSEFSRMQEATYFAHPTAIIDPGCAIGAGSQIWHFCHLMPGAVLGPDCKLGQNVFVASGVEIGRGVKIQNNVSLYAGLIIEDEVFLGPSCVFTNVINPRAAVNRQNEYIPTRIGKGATIGANATIICGNHIGAYAFIGAGAVVTKPVPAYALVMGNPAQQKGWMSQYGHKLLFDAHGDAVCPASGKRYRLNQHQVEEVAP